jgi:hypothetical protein
MAKNTPGKDQIRYEVITQEDQETGDLIIPIPEPILKRMGWKEGDEINIGVDELGRIFLKK